MGICTEAPTPNHSARNFGRGEARARCAATKQDNKTSDTRRRGSNTRDQDKRGLCGPEGMPFASSGCNARQERTRTKPVLSIDR